MSESSVLMLSSLIDKNESNYNDAVAKMQDLATYLKEVFELEDMFNDVLFGNDIGLTPGGQLALTIAVIEAAFAQRRREEADVHYRTLDTSLATLKQSVETIVESVKLSPASADIIPRSLLMGVDKDGKQWQLFSSLSLIKAWANQFCNIPPFCGEVN